jgi:hypothetical protein
MKIKGMILGGGGATIAPTLWGRSVDLDDDGSFSLPQASNSQRGSVQLGDLEEYAEFAADPSGNVTLLLNSANVVANSDTDGKLCVGTAPAQSPLVIKNRKGASKAVNAMVWGT